MSKYPSFDAVDDFLLLQIKGENGKPDSNSISIQRLASGDIMFITSKIGVKGGSYTNTVEMPYDAFKQLALHILAQDSDNDLNDF